MSQLVGHELNDDIEDANSSNRSDHPIYYIVASLVVRLQHLISPVVESYRKRRRLASEELDRLEKSPFTSVYFIRLETPIPVEDVFFTQWPLLVARLNFRIATYALLLNPSFIFMYMIALLWIYSLRRLGLRTRRRMSSNPLVDVWEYLSQVFLDKRLPIVFCRLWWFAYLMLVSMSEFRQNYVGAWQQKEEDCILVVGKDEILNIPMPSEPYDELVLQRIRMFYRMIQMESEIVGAVFPRLLERIDCIEFDPETHTLGGRQQTLQLGRYHGRLTNLFEKPELGRNTRVVADQVHAMRKDTALSFKQSYDIKVMSVVIMTPLLASCIFAIVWIRVYVHHKDVDPQALVTTAFTVAIYIVTSGAFLIAFVAFLDQKVNQNEDSIERITQRDR